MLIKMGSNLECVPFILSNLQIYLLNIISISEKYNTGSKLHKPLATLLNRLLQVIITSIIIIIELNYNLTN